MSDCHSLANAVTFFMESSKRPFYPPIFTHLSVYQMISSQCVRLENCGAEWKTSAPFIPIRLKVNSSPFYLWLRWRIEVPADVQVHWEPWIDKIMVSTGLILSEQARSL